MTAKNLLSKYFFVFKNRIQDCQIKFGLSL